MMRLDKYLSELGIGTRSQVKQEVKKGQVSVNGVTARDPGQRIDEAADTVCFQGKPLRYAQYEYYMFHKPAGCVTARTDGAHRTVMDYLDRDRRGLSPVGRLDLDTEGLLLITNDGALGHRLLSPANHVEKTYFARMEGTLAPEHVPLFASGLDIGDEKPTAPAKLVIMEGGPSSEALLTITEGRFHQVKRMFEAVGCRVTYLKRLSMGGLVLDEGLQPGEYRPLGAEELAQLGICPGTGKMGENGYAGTIRTDRSSDI